MTSVRFSAARLIIEKMPLGTIRDIEYKNFARPIRSSFLLCTSALTTAVPTRSGAPLIDCAPQEPQNSPVAVRPRPPSPLGSTSVSFHCSSTMSVISPCHAFGAPIARTRYDPPDGSIGWVNLVVRHALLQLPSLRSEALLPAPVGASRFVIRATRERGVGVPSSRSLSTASREANSVYEEAPTCCRHN